VRGLLISLKEAFIVGGILAGYAASYVYVEQLGGWRWMYGLAAAPAALLAAGEGGLKAPPGPCTASAACCLPHRGLPALVEEAGLGLVKAAACC
jgi:MFS family permease